jgi:2Fe-2S ferredoxin
MTTQKVNFIVAIDHQNLDIQADEGESLLQVKRRLPELARFECACDGSLACTTCHVIVDATHYELFDSESISEDEKDLLQSASGRTSTSRLGCQIKLTKEFEGAILTVPTGTAG